MQSKIGKHWQSDSSLKRVREIFLNFFVFFPNDDLVTHVKIDTTKIVPNADLVTHFFVSLPNTIFVFFKLLLNSTKHKTLFKYRSY
jgi:hypothetical protein